MLTSAFFVGVLLKTVDVGLVFERDDTCDLYANCVGDLDK